MIIIQQRYTKLFQGNCILKPFLFYLFTVLTYVKAVYKSHITLFWYHVKVVLKYWGKL